MKNLIERIKNIEVPTFKKPFSLLEIMYKRVYSKELIQSEMLSALLRPSENHGYDSELIESLLWQFEVDFELQENSNLKVETERNANGRRIDIFISWLDSGKKHAVIIENKLNNAHNQPNQLNDYHDIIVNEGYVVDKIVYMPFSKKWQKSEDTDTRKDVLAKTIDFDATDLVEWINSIVDEIPYVNDLDSAISNYQMYDVLRQYGVFLECLISNQYIMQQATEIQEKLSFEEIEKLEKVAELARTTEWCEVRFRPIVELILKGNFTKDLLVKYKQNRNHVNYAQFYFDNWENNFWYEVWLYPTQGIYFYKYDGEEYTEIKKFESSEINELSEYLIPLLKNLEKL
ncbi:MAG: PD-(D/E)XK nuclease family protein [Bacteroidales bacterium]|jgi:hypothetical protein|nr:PD-(D/E)XK nuclease family protein [Bacteroidales bacterium]